MSSSFRVGTAPSTPTTVNLLYLSLPDDSRMIHYFFVDLRVEFPTINGGPHVHTCVDLTASGGAPDFCVLEYLRISCGLYYTPCV